MYFLCNFLEKLIWKIASYVACLHFLVLVYSEQFDPVIIKIL